MSRFQIWGKEHVDENVAILDEEGKPAGRHKTARAKDAQGKPLLVTNGLMDTDRKSVV